MGRIILATDGSEYSEAAANFLLKRSVWRQDVEIDCLAVSAPLPSHVSRFLGASDIDAWHQENNQHALQPIESILRAAGQTFSSTMKVGHPAEEIVARAREVEADMIVMGTHGRGAFLGGLMGSVASRVLSMSSVPVVLVKKPG